MQEYVNDPFYALIKTYSGCILDYCLIADDAPHQGYRSHKDALLFAMCKVIERYIDYQLKAEISLYQGRPEEIDEEPFPWRMDIGKAKAERIDPVQFLHAPNQIEKSRSPKPQSDRAAQDALRDKQISYWYAFGETPHKPGYKKDDFVKINHALFPNGAESLEVYEWTTDWSNYFDAGHEWWGAGCWSVYDRSLNRYVVIMASTTD